MDKRGAMTAYSELNRRWKALCKTIFGEEIGEMEDYRGWLAENTHPLFMRKSSATGKEVSFVLPSLPKEGRFASLDEINFDLRLAPLSINDVKDIDSIARAVAERACYTGNIVLGNSKFVGGSADIIESFYIYKSAQISFSKYVAYGYNMEYAEGVFGTINHGHCNNSIRISDSNFLSRCFETYGSEQSSELYFAHKLFNCRDCLFSFNLRNARNAIGNLQLEQGKYAALKKKLLAEMAATLKKEKKLPGLLEMAGRCGQDVHAVSALRQKLPPLQKKVQNKEAIEGSFEKATAVILGKGLRGMENYRQYLGEYARKTVQGKSAMSGEPIMVADYARYLDYPKDRLLTEQEAELAGKALKITEQELDGLDLAKAGKAIGKIAYFHPGFDHGKLINIIDSQVNLDSVNCFRGILNLYSKNCAYNFYTLESESVFGCNSVRKSSFAIRCCLSSKLTRCFEVDSSSNCSDAYFCHNCENVHDSMFCFNAKNMWNAIGNAQYAKGEYARVKKLVLAEIGARLEKDKKLKWDIYSIGARK
jgi:hypothetical protein